jgi:maleylacetoacetate isomerase
MTQPTLYGYFRSSCSWRVRIALAFKNITPTQVPVHLVQDGGQQHGLAHHLRNPMHQVPVFEVHGEQLAQSMAILGYIEEMHPNPSLLPDTPMQRAKCMQFSEMINAGIQPLQNLAVMQRLQKSHGWTKQQALEWSAHWIHSGLLALEAFTESVSGQYAIGDDITLADCCLYPQLYNAKRFGLSMDDYPRIAQIEANLSKVDAFITSDPSRQADTPPELCAPN